MEHLTFCLIGRVDVCPQSFHLSGSQFFSDFPPSSLSTITELPKTSIILHNSIESRRQCTLQKTRYIQFTQLVLFRMHYYPSTFWVILIGVSVFNTFAVVGFSSHALSPANTRIRKTILRYVRETNFPEGQYHRFRPRDVKVIDVEVEKNPQFTFIPTHEVDDAVKKAQANHERDCTNMQNIINDQRKELERLKELNEKSNSSEKIQREKISLNGNVSWDENHDEKMKRAKQRVQYLMNENERLQIELDGERERFEVEKGRLQQKLEKAMDETVEAEQILSLERSYFETGIKLLEAALERESKNVRALENQLFEYNEQIWHHGNYHTSHDDVSSFDTVEVSSAYEQGRDRQQSEFHQHASYGVEDIEEFQPQVRPQGVPPQYSQESCINIQSSSAFQTQEPHGFQQWRDSQIPEQDSYVSSNSNSSPRRATVATTTVMGASSIKGNLGINNHGINVARERIRRI